MKHSIDNADVFQNGTSASILVEASNNSTVTRSNAHHGLLSVLDLEVGSWPGSSTAWGKLKAFQGPQAGSLASTRSAPFIND